MESMIDNRDEGALLDELKTSSDILKTAYKEFKGRYLEFHRKSLNKYSKLKASIPSNHFDLYKIRMDHAKRYKTGLNGLKDEYGELTREAKSVIRELKVKRKECKKSFSYEKVQEAIDLSGEWTNKLDMKYQR